MLASIPTKLWDIRAPLGALFKIKTFDEALAIYIKILRDKTVSSAEELLLRPLSTNNKSQGKFPLQVRLFRK
jgi:hypothetical protein